MYSSDQTEEEAHERDLAAFDRELLGDPELDRYLQNPDRVTYLDDFALEDSAWNAREYDFSLIAGLQP